VRVVVAEDSALFREGVVRLLEAAGHEVVDALGDAGILVESVERHRPDIAIIDVRMPPTHTDDGAVAATRIRAILPHQPILMLSQHVEIVHSTSLVSTGAFGYLLKDRVLRVDAFLDAVVRVAAGGSALDPLIVGALIRPAEAGLARLTVRERDVLALVAEGHSNAAVARSLVLAERTVETHMRAIFRKLLLEESTDGHRRVLAVLAFLRALQ